MKSGRRETTIKQREEVIPTRIFRTNNAVRISGQGDEDTNVQRLQETKLFSPKGNVFLCPPPHQCFYSASSLSSNKKIDPFVYNLEKWITVFCIDKSKKDEIIKFFNQFGEISSVISPEHNYISIEFVNKSDAETLLHLEQPILLPSNTAIFIESGRYCPSTTQEEKPLTFEVPSLPFTMNGEISLPEIQRQISNFFRWNFF